MKEHSAYSMESGVEYPNWEALVHAEANGYVVTAIISNDKRTWPWSIGPFDHEDEAAKARNRLRYRLRKELGIRKGFTFKVFVRPLWKEKP